MQDWEGQCGIETCQDFVANQGVSVEFGPWVLANRMEFQHLVEQTTFSELWVPWLKVQ